MGFPVLHVPTEEARCEWHLQAHYCDNGVYWRVSASTLLSTAVCVQGWQAAIQTLYAFGVVLTSLNINLQMLPLLSRAFPEFYKQECVHSGEIYCSQPFFVAFA